MVNIVLENPLNRSQNPMTWAFRRSHTKMNFCFSYMLAATCGLFFFFFLFFSLEQLVKAKVKFGVCVCGFSFFGGVTFSLFLFSG